VVAERIEPVDVNAAIDETILLRFDAEYPDGVCCCAARISVALRDSLTSSWPIRPSNAPGAITGVSDLHNLLLVRSRVNCIGLSPVVSLIREIASVCNRMMTQLRQASSSGCQAASRMTFDCSDQLCWDRLVW
jgi:hypothetical protein